MASNSKGTLLLTAKCERRERKRERERKKDGEHSQWSRVSVGLIAREKRERMSDRNDCA